MKSRTARDDGEIFDHFAVQFEYEDGSISFSECRHQPGCWNSVSEHVVGTKGSCDVSGHKILGANPWRYKAEGAKDPYQQEHDDLFAAIRNNQDYSEAVAGAESTMTAIFGRMAAYSGKELEWNAAIESKIELLPKELGFDKPTPVNPGPRRLLPARHSRQDAGASIPENHSFTENGRRAPRRPFLLLATPPAPEERSPV